MKATALIFVLLLTAGCTAKFSACPPLDESKAWWVVYKSVKAERERQKIMAMEAMVDSLHKEEANQ